MDKNATRYNVQLYIYDLSRGMARSLSPIMLGEYRWGENSTQPGLGENKWLWRKPRENDRLVQTVSGQTLIK